MIKSKINKTLYALSSGHGKSAISVIRITGEHALQSVYKMTMLKNIKPNILKLSKIYYPGTRSVIDKGLICFFKNPNSFTGEDLVEFHVHGSLAVVKAMYKALESLENYVAAEKGDFTKRAFENGKLDILEVEALHDLLESSVERQRVLAIKQTESYNKESYEKIRLTTINALSDIEALIDFGEEEGINKEIIQKNQAMIKSTIKEIEELINNFARSENIKNGIKLVIFGPPNSGKSSFLNIFCKEDLAIVSEIKGTTRDTLKHKMDFKGYPIVINDTAGIHTTSNELEKEGIKRSYKAIEQSDIKIMMIDPTILKTKEIEILKKLIDKDTLMLVNKTDILKPDVKEISQMLNINNNSIFKISCLTKTGIKEFNEKLLAILSSKYNQIEQENYIVVQSRHKKLLEEYIKHASKFIDENMDVVAAGEELRIAANCIGKIIGKIETEDILDKLFSSFCIGK